MAAKYWADLKKNDPEKYHEITHQEERCECRFKTLKIKMKNHKSSELHKFLMVHKYGKVRGTDKVQCPHCTKQITLSGLLTHIQYNH